MYISDSYQSKIDDFTLKVSPNEVKPTCKMLLNDCLNDDTIIDIIEQHINKYHDKSVSAIINNDCKSYNIVDYDYNLKCLHVTDKYYLMMDEIMYYSNYLPNSSNLNLFIHIF